AEHAISHGWSTAWRSGPAPAGTNARSALRRLLAGGRRGDLSGRGSVPGKTRGGQGVWVEGWKAQVPLAHAVMTSWTWRRVAWSSAILVSMRSRTASRRQRSDVQVVSPRSVAWGARMTSSGGGDLVFDAVEDGLEAPALGCAGGVPSVGGVERVDDLVEGEPESLEPPGQADALHGGRCVAAVARRRPLGHG